MSNKTVHISDTVKAYIARHNLLDAGAKHIVALSGGADSVALLLLLQEQGYDIEAAHCNFHLRGAESDRDEQFVVSLCRKRNIPLHLVHFDTREYAALHKVSIEMAARQLRYGYFERLRQDIGAADICVAHHRDDNVETVIMNLVRGTGLRGLAGIRPRNGHIIRPLLCISRHDIEQYLDGTGQEYITDSSNLVDDVVRNKLRLNIIPMLKDINPAVADNIQRTTEHVNDAMALLGKAVADAAARVSQATDDGGMTIDIYRLHAETSPTYILYELLKDYGFSAAQMEQAYACTASPEGQLFEAVGFDMLIDRDRIIVARHHEAVRPIKIIEEGNYILSDGRRLKLKRRQINGDFAISRLPHIACLDADRVRFPLTLRPSAKGDRFVPFGMNGSKLVSDYLTDRKKTLFEKRRQLVLADASGDIIWLVGERTDNRFRIADNSRSALEMEVDG